MTLRQFLSIVELRTKIVSLSTFILATLWVFVTQGHVDPLLTVLLLIAALAVDMGTTAFNSFFDYWNGTDNAQFNQEGDKVLVHEGVPAASALFVGLGLYFTAAIFGLIITLLTGWQILVAGCLCMAVGFFYTGGPWPISRTPFGEVFAGGFLGGVFFLITAYALKTHLTSADLCLAIPSTLIIASILTVNNTCDQVGDKAAGRRTLTILIGPKLSPALIPLLGLLTLGSALTTVALGYLTVWAVIPLLSGAALSLPIYKKMFARGFDQTTKGPSMGSISQIFLIYTLSQALALGLTLFLR